MEKEMNYKIESIMNEFDFLRVRRAMVALDWVWYGGVDNDLVVPSIDMLKQTARRLLNTAEKEQTIVSTGGFEAEYCLGGLTLRFVVDSAVGYERED